MGEPKHDEAPGILSFSFSIPAQVASYLLRPITIVSSAAAVMPLLVEALAPLLEFQHIVALRCTAPFAPPRLTASMCPARTGVRIGLGTVAALSHQLGGADLPRIRFPGIRFPRFRFPHIMCVGASNSGSNALLAFHYKRAALVEYRDGMWILYRPLVQEQERTCCISHNVSHRLLVYFYQSLSRHHHSLPLSIIGFGVPFLTVHPSKKAV